MKFLIQGLILLSVGLLFFTSCLKVEDFSQVFSQTQDLASSRDKRVPQASSFQGSGEKCGKVSSCTKICDRIYLKASSLDKCYNTSESEVEKIEEVFDELRNPSDVDDLEGINDRYLSRYLGISAQGFIDLIDPINEDYDGDRDEVWEDVYAYDENHAEVVLEWICEDESVQKAIRKYKDHSDKTIVSHLLDVIRREDPDNMEDVVDEVCPSICYNGSTLRYPYEFYRPKDDCDGSSIKVSAS